MRRKKKRKKGEYSEAELVDLSRLYESLNIGNPAGPSSALARFLRHNAHLVSDPLLIRTNAFPLLTRKVW